MHASPRLFPSPKSPPISRFSRHASRLWHPPRRQYMELQLPICFYKQQKLFYQKQKKAVVVSEFKRSVVTHKRHSKSHYDGDTMELSQDVLICLFSFLDMRSLVAAGLVCKCMGSTFFIFTHSMQNLFNAWGPLFVSPLHVQAKLAKLRRELLTPSSKGGGATGEGFDVIKSGDVRVGLVGFPSVGKSTLNKLTGTFSEVASYEFTTLTCISGIIMFKRTKIQD